MVSDLAEMTNKILKQNVVQRINNLIDSIYEDDTFKHRWLFLYNIHILEILITLKSYIYFNNS